MLMFNAAFGPQYAPLDWAKSGYPWIQLGCQHKMEAGRTGNKRPQKTMVATVVFKVLANLLYRGSVQPPEGSLEGQVIFYPFRNES